MRLHKIRIKSNRLLLFILVLTVVAFAIIVALVSGTKFPIDYANGRAVNDTVAENNARTMIQAQVVPSVVNGIATATSIIVGFSGAIIGIMFREIFGNDKKAKEVLVIFLVLFIFSIGFLFNAYFSFITGGQYILENALRNAYLGFAFSVFTLLFLMLFISLLFENTGKIDFDRCQDY